MFWLNRRYPRVLLYHACAPDESSPFIRGIDANTRPGDFARDMAFVKRHYTPIPLSALAGDAPVAAMAAAVTFDDGYRSVLEHAVPILERLDIPATIFLIAGVLTGEAVVWVNELNWAMVTAPDVAIPIVMREMRLSCAPEPRTILHHARAQFDTERVRATLDALRTSIGYDPAQLARDARLYMTVDEVAALRGKGIAFGNHTVTHPSMPAIPAAEQRREIEDAARAMASLLDPVAMFALPFGDKSDEVRDSARAAGQALVVEVGGFNRPLIRDRIGRAPVRATSDAELFAEVEIVEPLRSALKRLLRR